MGSVVEDVDFAVSSFTSSLLPELHIHSAQAVCARD